MEFRKLHGDTACNCLTKAESNETDLFARKINKPFAREKDFDSKWEKGNVPFDLNPNDCRTVCGLKGISVNIWNENSQEHVIEKFVTTFRISPRHKDSILVFKFREQSGMVEFTPNRLDEFHYDFYKSDDFALDRIDKIQIINLADFV